MGNFDGWDCKVGNVTASGGQNTVSLIATTPVADRHLLIPPTNTERDEFAGFPKHCPSVSSYSVRLGNGTGGHEAEGLSYTYAIPAGLSKFSLLYYYAIVLQNPGHQFQEQPRFRARVVDVASESEIDCVTFDFTASGSLPGFTPTAAGGAVYKDWTPVSVDLTAFIGKTVRLEFITSDCTFTQHFGYAYISVASSCNGSITGNYRCDDDTAINLNAPYGFEEYTWYADDNFSQVVSTQQSLSVSAATTPIGATFPVIVKPYVGYGCLDTLYATINGASKPVSEAGSDRVTCSKKPIELGTQGNDDYSYDWTPREYLSNPAVANPFTLPTILTPTKFFVKTTDLVSGCFSVDSTIITPVLVDTSSSVIGNTLFCPNATIQTQLLAGAATAQYQWFKTNTAISGATGAAYRPSTIGTYWAEVKQNGCVDSTREWLLRELPFPKAAFISSKEVQCNQLPVSFSNQTTIQGNEPVKYLWRFSDGTTSPLTNPEKLFSSLGTASATLIATSGTDCVDSVSKTVLIVANCAPLIPTAFTPNGDGKNDVFKPYLASAKSLKRFAIYNRYGNLVYSTSKEGDGWDGMYNGKPLATGVFVWVLEYISYDNRPLVERGTVTLIK